MWPERSPARKRKVPVDFLAQLAPELPIKSPFPRGEQLDGNFASETVRREVGDVAEEIPEVEGGLLERETGIEPATLSLGREDEPEEDPPLTL